MRERAFRGTWNREWALRGYECRKRRIMDRTLGIWALERIARWIGGGTTSKDVEEMEAAYRDPAPLERYWSNR